MKFVGSISEPLSAMRAGQFLVVRFKRNSRLPSITEKIERIEVSRKGTRVTVNRRYVFDNYCGTFDRAISEDEVAKTVHDLAAASMAKIAARDAA